MLVVEETVEIRVLRRQGKSVCGIARMLEVSRNTVRRYLRRARLPHYEPGARPSKLDQYKQYLAERVGPPRRSGYRRRCCCASLERSRLSPRHHRQHQWRELPTQGQAQGGTTRCSGQDGEALEQLVARCQRRRL